MAGDAPSAWDWVRSQLRRKPTGGGESAPGTGGGLRPSFGMVVVLVLCVVVVIVVLTSSNGGTPAKHAGASGSPSPSGTPSGEPAPDGQADRAPESPDAGKSGAAPATGGKHSPVGKTAYTRQTYGLIVRDKPSQEAGVVAKLGYDNAVTLVCHTTGPQVYGRGMQSNLWDKVTTPGGNTGYVPDVWVLTAADVKTLVDPC
ncbi:hypothetical protein [Yinghuangia seranimata]|uniref:hypothetical protein n=1 Tax=Yinghuangia seranimata TaxID=408067 RepID=UPI00248B11EA|nr:hypothetical protein [Yinghuangia seranimata]MDI2128185.1 hypothetical protein [Yinghuangia seranimata]